MNRVNFNKLIILINNNITQPGQNARVTLFEWAREDGVLISKACDGCMKIHNTDCRLHQIIADWLGVGLKEAESLLDVNDYVQLMVDKGIGTSAIYNSVVGVLEIFRDTGELHWGSQTDQEKVEI